MYDIDIDFANRDDILNRIPHVKARRIQDGKVTHHSTGIHVQSIPCDPNTNIAGIEYEEAQSRGYFKVDLLNLSIYTKVKNEQHLLSLMDQEPLWDLLEQKDFCDLIFHVNGYHQLIAELKPTSIEQLAMFLALIRPGKKHLIPKVKTHGWASITDEIWTKSEDSYSFKKSHAVSYAVAVVVHMNLVCESVSYGYS
jgi:DNA polymerase III alpha subunit